MCDRPCPGSTTELCGGTRYNAIYHTIVPSTTSDTSLPITIHYPIGFGTSRSLSSRYCHFTTETHNTFLYSAVDSARLLAKNINQPFMLYKMNNCLSNKWDRVYTSEMYKCLLSMPVQDSDATAVVPSITPDFSGSAGERHFIYPTCSRLSSAASVANTISPCLTFQRHVPVNDSISWNSDESKFASMTDGTTHGYAHPGLASKRISIGSINNSWSEHMVIDSKNVVPTENPTDNVLLHTMDIIGLQAKTTYTFSMTATNELPLTSLRGIASYPVTTALPNRPNAPQGAIGIGGIGSYFVNVTWNTPLSDGGRSINNNYLVDYYTSTDATHIRVNSADVVVHPPVNLDETTINKRYVRFIFFEMNNFFSLFFFSCPVSPQQFFSIFFFFFLLNISILIILYRLQQ